MIVNIAEQNCYAPINTGALARCWAGNREISAVLTAFGHRIKPLKRFYCPLLIFHRAKATVLMRKNPAIKGAT
jgi:hypothetical protein